MDRKLEIIVYAFSVDSSQNVPGFIDSRIDSHILTEFTQFVTDIASELSSVNADTTLTNSGYFFYTITTPRRSIEIKFSLEPQPAKPDVLASKYFTWLIHHVLVGTKSFDDVVLAEDYIFELTKEGAI